MTEIEFLKSLPVDGSLKVLQPEELQTAFELHTQKLCFLTSGQPQMLARITFEGRKFIARDW